MTHTHRELIAAALAAGLLTALGGVAEAQDYVVRAEDDHVRHRPSVAFLEGHGAYGVQFGETDYLPSGAPGDYQHPIVMGPSFGGTLGVMLADNVALFGAYDYTRARSRTGELDGAIESVRGGIDYHTAVAGLRLYVPIGYGALRAELGGGVIMPYHTTLTVEYGPGLSQLPTPISGTGTRVDYYSVGFGGQAALGYQLPIFKGFYGLVNVRYRLFESENSGERTELTNFVTDYEAPAATTATVEYGDGAARPSTNSVQDVRLQVGFGYQF